MMRDFGECVKNHARDVASHIVLSAALGVVSTAADGVVHRTGLASNTHDWCGWAWWSVRSALWNAPMENLKLQALQLEGSAPLSKVVGGIWASSGVLGFFRRYVFRGAFLGALRVFPVRLFYQLAEDKIVALHRHSALAVCKNSNPVLSFIKSLGIGSLAKFGAQILVYPIDFIRTHLALDQDCERYASSTAVITETMQGPDGVLGLYHGLGMSLASILPHSATFYFLQDHALPILFPYMRSGWVQTIASTVASFVSWPFDTVRRHLMMDDKREYSGAMDCAQKIIAKDGVFALWNGFFLWAVVPPFTGSVLSALTPSVRVGAPVAPKKPNVRTVTRAYTRVADRPERISKMGTGAEFQHK